MDVVPVSVGRASRAWEEQQRDLAAASRQIDGAGAHGFTSGVSGMAARFTSAWTRHAAGLGTDCEARADGLRAALADYLATDELTFGELVALGGHFAEVR